MRPCAECRAEVADEARFCPFCGAAAPGASAAPGDPHVGEVVNGKYRVEALIGQGGMGRVYRARHLALDRAVVLKMLHRGFSGDPAVAERFQREARAASRLDHPNSIAVLDFGQAEDGTLFMVMEYLAGKDLARVIAEEFPLGDARIIRIGAQILSALAEAHARGVVHRDLKPENVMVEPRRDEPDFVKVLDFGIAKIERSGAQRAPAHPGRAGVRHARVHEPGAGPGQGARRPQRPLLGGGHPLPDGHGAASLRVGHARRLPHEAPRRAARPALAAASGPRGVAGARGPRPARAREEPGRPAALRGGDAPGRARLRAPERAGGAARPGDEPPPARPRRGRRPAGRWRHRDRRAAAGNGPSAPRPPSPATPVSAPAPPATPTPIAAPAEATPGPPAPERKPARRPARKPDRARAVALYERAEARRAAQDARGAIQLYLAAEAADPTLHQVHKKLALCYQQQGDRRRAAERYRKYLATNPDDADKVKAILAGLR